MVGLVGGAGGIGSRLSSASVEFSVAGAKAELGNRRVRTKSKERHQQRPNWKMKENTPTNISLEDIEDTPKSKVDIGATLRQGSQKSPLRGGGRGIFHLNIYMGHMNL